MSFSLPVVGLYLNTALKFCTVNIQLASTVNCEQFGQSHKSQQKAVAEGLDTGHELTHVCQTSVTRVISPQLQIFKLAAFVWA